MDEIDNIDEMDEIDNIDEIDEIYNIDQIYEIDEIDETRERTPGHHEPPRFAPSLLSGIQISYYNFKFITRKGRY